MIVINFASRYLLLLLEQHRLVRLYIKIKIRTLLYEKDCNMLTMAAYAGMACYAPTGCCIAAPGYITIC